MKADAVLIAGPTASGKSSAALALAEAIGGVIVNADSMQVYAEPRVLTARPSDADMARVPHLLYGHVSAREPYSVGRYQADAAAALVEVHAMGRTPIFVGGTGLYFGALTDGLSDVPSVPAAIRDATAARRSALGADAFFAELSARDPQTAAKLHASDTQRTLRAYEVLEATGRPLAEWQAQSGRPVLAGLALARFVIAPPRAELHARIDARFERMIEQGAMNEAAALDGLDPALPAAKLLGLRELLAARAGAMTLDDAATAAKVASRQYAKRQMTWFWQRMRDWAFVETADQMNDALGSTDIWKCP
ncbi:MAG TPA: tRNA (adenosine(37)-N6)-dimethylallyltransferase MiaA [Rhizomicrobium sp.]|nr:tRNA (adenosine(37)-N6)-dimethylallyltransferase MiaA [Rhizomicrobium sp.]